MKRLLALSALVLFAGACGPKAPLAKPTIALPDMAMNPTPGCGQGSFLVSNDIQMAMEQADANARAGLAAALEASIERVAEQTREQLQTGDKTNNLSSATTGLREIIDAKMVGTAPTRREQVGQQLWSEVCLDLETFGEIIAGMQTMGSQMQDAIRQQHKAITSNMDQILKEKRDREAGQ